MYFFILLRLHFQNISPFRFPASRRTMFKNPLKRRKRNKEEGDLFFFLDPTRQNQIEGVFEGATTHVNLSPSLYEYIILNTKKGAAPLIAPWDLFYTLPLSTVVFRLRATLYDLTLLSIKSESDCCSSWKMRICWEWLEIIAVEERNKVDGRYVDYVTDDDIEKRALGRARGGDEK